MGQSCACTEGFCQLPVPSCPSEPSTGPPVPSILLCRALGMGRVMMALRAG